ncbi:MAG: lanthionine synthetase LanC family protein, partial [Gaiellaceae bacterium]
MLAQGWKLHVSATQFSAVPVLDAALAVLLDEGARFKVVSSINLVTMLNAGHFGLSQIGKYLTVYPSDDAQAVRLATALDRVTSGHRGPRVPTDRPLRPESLVHYRYGVMHQGLEGDTGGEEAVDGYDLLDPAGRLTNDFRLHYYLPPPAGIDDPFEDAGAYVPRPARSHLLNGRYLVVNGLSQGIRGGVFRAIDLGATPARFCLLKEAWHDVSVDRCGRDARDWLVNEERILVRHEGSSALPRFYDSFDLDDNHYIAIEYFEGTTLAQVLSDDHSINDGISVAEIIAVGQETAGALAQLHELGLVFRDFSPANVIATPDGGYRLIDFGTCFDAAEDGAPPIGGGTPPFYPREQFDREHPAPSDDVFAWGAVLHYLCCGVASVADMPEEDYGLRPFARRPVAELRPGFPPRIAGVIDRAVAWERRDRYETMREVHRALVQAAAELEVRSPRAPAVPGQDPTAPGTEGSAGTAISRAALTRLACEVGDALCAVAEERGGGVCWAARDQLSSRTEYGPDLYSGAAGIGLFLAELSRATGEPQYAETARAAARWLAGPAWGRGRAQHGLHCGEPGVSYFFLSLAELLDEPGFVTAAELRMRRLQGVPFATADLTHGAAGTILALVELHRVTGEFVYLAAARTAGDELVRTALRGPEDCPGCYWDVAPPAPGGFGVPYLGLLHGAAGIGLALTKLARVTGEERYLDVAESAASLLLAQARAGDSGDDCLTWPRRLGDD